MIRPDHSHRSNVFYCLRLSAIEARSHPPSLCARYVVTVIVTISLALRNTLVYYPPPVCNVRNENECISDSDKYLGIPRTAPPFTFHRLPSAALLSSDTSIALLVRNKQVIVIAGSLFFESNHLNQYIIPLIYDDFTGSRFAINL